MKFLNKTAILLSFLGLPFSSEAKQLDFILDRTIVQTIECKDFISSIRDQIGECPTCPRKNGSKDEHLFSCHTITLENKGTLPIENCFPHVNKDHLFSLEHLAEQLKESDRPLLTLYRLWSDFVTIDDSADACDEPLYILNYKGYCSKQDYLKNFINLCGLLGIDVRRASLQDKECYDFCYDNDQWEFLDPITQQIYLGLDNQTLVSSEELMDDPFLAIRTKHHRRCDHIDFKESWKQLAHFEIVNSYLNEEMLSVRKDLNAIPALTGFNLAPKDTLVYYIKSQEEKPAQGLVKHIVSINDQQSLHAFTYSSPLPIQEIHNHTTSVMTLEDTKQVLQPGESIIIDDAHTFSLKISSQESSATGSVHFISLCSTHLFPLLNVGENALHLGSNANPSQVQITYDLDDRLDQLAYKGIKVVNQQAVFDYCAPFFELEQMGQSSIDRIWWQISSDADFSLIPSNFEQIEDFKTTIHIPAITDTFFNADDTYFFRVKAYVDGHWSDWSTPFAFITKKPEPVLLIEFDKLEDHAYEISWEQSEEDVEYLVFGSNSLDFIPSVYTDVQINGIVGNEMIDVQSNDNLKLITKDNKIVVDGSFAYYRIIVRQHGHLSVPSRLIYVYDYDLIQRRDVLQTVYANGEHSIIKRVELRSSSSAQQMSASDLFPTTSNARNESQLFDLPFKALRSLTSFRSVLPFVQNKYVSNEAWATVKPYLMPDNHPIRAKLDRIFSESRAIQTPEHFKKAGFKNYKPRRASHIMASPHPKLTGYYIKAFPDTELRMIEDWKKLAHRVKGANDIRGYLVEKGYHHQFKVPKKWLYALPEYPSPPSGGRYIRKNFVLIAEDMRIYEPEQNNKMYKKKITKRIMEAIYNTIMDLGLYDTVYAFNLPFSKDGKLAFIDTEYHHRWPVPHHKFKRYFSKDMQKYWDKLVKEGDRQHRNDAR